MIQMKSNSRPLKILIVEDQFVEAHHLQLILENASYIVTGIAISAAQALEMIRKNRPDFVFVDIFLKGNETGIDLAKKLRESHIGFIYLSANSDKLVLDKAKETHPYGFIVKPYREKEVLVTLEIASYRHNYSIETLLIAENTLRKGIDQIINSSVKWEIALTELGKLVQTYIPFDYMEAGPGDGKSNTGLLLKSYDSYETIDAERLLQIAKLKKAEIEALHLSTDIYNAPEIFTGESFIKICHEFAYRRMVVHAFGIRSFIVLPIALPDKNVFNFFFYSRDADAFGEEHVRLLTSLQASFEKLLAGCYPKKNEKGSRDTGGKTKDRDASPGLEGFESMIGNSPKIISVFNLIKKVAPSETSVLILGESGTGKEKVARAIHNLSTRKGKPFVVINCSTIPEDLAESLLFGHEKGAFTGAADKRAGKFEIADGGTVFLDEIGEMPLDLQVKLLRVLQEKEIEKIGAQAPLPVDVRIIAATNRNLEEEVSAGRFRLDLYYRLYVFPIIMPSLRERKEDIPALVAHFIRTFNKTGIISPSPDDEIIKKMLQYEWPGNIRELENVIQRSILLTEGNVITEISLQALDKKNAEVTPQEYSIKTMHENERDYISYILKKCKGKVSGSGGAAEILGIPGSTLTSKMKKLGIAIEKL
jgi:formate hydrogenlyase transcriptional activator